MKQEKGLTYKATLYKFMIYNSCSVFPDTNLSKKWEFTKLGKVIS